MNQSDETGDAGASGPPQDERRIEDYALIGDCSTAALVGRDGSVDWLCMPRFDSAACLARLLGDEDNGFWRIAPVDRAASVSRRYADSSLVLQTDFETASGKVRVTDFMPPDAPKPSLVRVVTGLSGRVDMRLDLCVRFDYGRRIPWLYRESDGALAAVAGPHLVLLRTPAQIADGTPHPHAEFTVGEGDTVPFTLTYCASYHEPPAPFDTEDALRRTIDKWETWIGQCAIEGRWRDEIVRSLITLKALTFAETGGVVAAPTTSLPELAGGTRNWDYRFCWLRDATFTLLALMNSGFTDEAEAWRSWLVRAIAGSATQIQPLYTILGENRIDEWELPWLSGFGGATPVRAGNAAAGQLQIDTFGEVLDALHHARRSNLSASEESWALQVSLLEHLEKIKDTPDRGIWELRGDKRHFTHSKVMTWVAFDRAVHAVEDFGMDGPAGHWREIRDARHAEICDRAFDTSLNAFVQSYGATELDSAVLLMPLVGFIAADDPRMLGTVEAIEKRLMRDGLLLRYDTDALDDGLPAGEGAFLACSFWYVDNLTLQGRREEAEAMFARLADMANDVGLLAEEYDIASGTALGNFPQALSHLALVNSALNLHSSHGPAQQRSGQDAESGEA